MSRRSAAEKIAPPPTEEALQPPETVISAPDGATEGSGEEAVVTDPGSSGEVQDPPAEQPKPAPRRGNLEPMDTAPQDGKFIGVFGASKQYAEAFWRNSRRQDPQNGRWIPFGYWALRNSGGSKLGFDPMGWRAL